MILKFRSDEMRADKYKNDYNKVIKSLKDINKVFNKDLILNNKGFLSPTYNYDNHYTFYFMLIKMS